MDKLKRPVGRPTLYKPEYCQEIVECCAQGHSITGFAGKIGVNRDTITEWGNQHPEFALAIKNAKSAAAYGIENDATRVRSRGGGPGTAAMVIFQLKNFAPDDYKDKQETATTISNPDGTPLIPVSVVVHLVRVSKPDDVTYLPLEAANSVV